MDIRKLLAKKQNTARTYSMQFRFLVTVIFAMFAVTVFIGGISIYEVDNYIQSQTEDFVKATCENESTQINDCFGDMEKSVQIMESYVMGFFSSKEDFEDRALQEKVIKNADEMFVDVAQHTSGAVTYYFRFAPEISDSKTGLFYSKPAGSDEYVSLEPTDLSLYDKDDTEHVGWYWQPYEAGKPLWMKPYYNQNNDVLMISYVVPMYFEDKFVGIVGMDFDYMVLAERVHEIKIYNNGFAHLEIDGVVIHDDDAELAERASASEDDYLRVSKELMNGMTLVLSASYDDIRQIRYEIAFKILFAVVILSGLLTLVAIVVVRKIVDPLNKLTKASVKLAKGDYDVEIVQSNTREIKLLSEAFENMTTQLHEREELLLLSANHDSLTGLRNTTAYAAWVEKFDNEIADKNADFGVVVLDVNGLKNTNDKHGHATGNEIIIAAAKVVSDVFKRSPVFRVGGDEFLVVLQNRDLENCEKLLAQLDLECENKCIEKENTKIAISIAKGFARFDPSKDLGFIDVFKRADVAMYENKRIMKAASV